MTAATANLGSSLCIGITTDTRCGCVAVGLGRVRSFRTRRAMSNFVARTTKSAPPSSDMPRVCSTKPSRTSGTNRATAATIRSEPARRHGSRRATPLTATSTVWRRDAPDAPARRARPRTPPSLRRSPRRGPARNRSPPPTPGWLPPLRPSPRVSTPPAALIVRPTDSARHPCRPDPLPPEAKV